MNPMKPRVVLDTNVLISALIWVGKPSKILDAVKRGKVELILSKEILMEFVKVLFRETKFKLSQNDIEDALNMVSDPATLIEPIIAVDLLKDRSDNKILECAISSSADYIVSGDKDLLRLEKFAGIKLVSVSDFLKLVAL